MFFLETQLEDAISSSTDRVEYSPSRVLAKSSTRQVECSPSQKTTNKQTTKTHLPLSSPPGPVARKSFGEQKAHPGISQHSLLHGEALLVVSTADSHDVALELLSEDSSVHLLGHSAVIQLLQSLLIINLNELLEPSLGGCNINLHF